MGFFITFKNLCHQIALNSLCETPILVINLQWDEVMSARAQLQEQQQQPLTSADTGITTHTPGLCDLSVIQTWI